MKPGRPENKVKNIPPLEERLSKGDDGMRIILSIAAAIYFAAATCACAGTFDTLAAAAADRPPAPFYMQPGSVVKTEFKSNIRTDSDVDLEADFSNVAQAAAKNTTQVQPKPAVAYRERRSGSMAPPPSTRQSDRSSRGKALAAEEQDSELEADLEKDLVLTPPPPKTEEKADRTPKSPTVEKKGIEKKSVVSETKNEKKKAEPRVKKIAPPNYEQYAVGSRPIQKVRPVTKNWWSFPAGAYEPRPCPVEINNAAPSGYTGCVPSRDTMNRQYRGSGQEYTTWPRGGYEAQRGAVATPTGDRIVRDGVTIKLAPAAAPATYSEYPEESSGSDILSAAVEIIGMPFALIGSLF